MVRPNGGDDKVRRGRRGGFAVTWPSVLDPAVPLSYQTRFEFFRGEGATMQFSDFSNRKLLQQAVLVVDGESIENPNHVNPEIHFFFFWTECLLCENFLAFRNVISTTKCVVCYKRNPVAVYGTFIFAFFHIHYAHT